MTFDRVAADAYDFDVEFIEYFECIAETASFVCTSNGKIFRIEIQYARFVEHVFIEREHLSASGKQREVWSFLTEGERHVMF
jgi:hypothetical protein